MEMSPIFETLNGLIFIPEGVDNVLDLHFVGHRGQDRRVPQHTVVQRVLSLQNKKNGIRGQKCKSNLSYEGLKF